MGLRSTESVYGLEEEPFSGVTVSIESGLVGLENTIIHEDEEGEIAAELQEKILRLRGRSLQASPLTNPWEVPLRLWG